MNAALEASMREQGAVVCARITEDQPEALRAPRARPTAQRMEVPEGGTLHVQFPAD